MSRDRPIERCPECGNVLKMDYVGPEDSHHDDHGHGSHDARTSSLISYSDPQIMSIFDHGTIHG